MAKITKPLNDTELKSSVAKIKDYSLYDGKGLSLLVKKNGAKLWRYKYKHPAGHKMVQLGLGKYPEVTLAESRKIRDEGNTLLATTDLTIGIGIDPQTYWKEQKVKAEHDHINTFEHTAKAWFAIKVNEVSPDYAHDIWRSLEKDLLPAIGKLPIKTLNAPLIIKAIQPVAARGALETVRRLCQRINEIMDYATNVGLIEANPATGIKKAFKRPEEKNLPSLKPEELPQFLQTMSRANITISTRAVIEWQLHTMTRPSEASGARWDEVDLLTKVWTIPAERMKRKKAHSIPLTEQAIAILNVMKPINGHRNYIFVGSKDPRKPMNSSTANIAIKRMGYQGKLVAHGLRSIASTTLNEQGFDPDIIEAALAHVDTNEVRRAYNRAEYLERRRKMMCWWSNKIDNDATGKVTIAHGTQGLRQII
jgi:integrase